MSKTSIKNGKELQLKFQQAQHGERITLNIGAEYQGPLYVSKPLILQGHGVKSPLFSSDGPCLLILSPNVRLENLDITCLNGFSDIVCLQNVFPEIVSVRINGKLVTMLDNQTAIDLGDIVARQQVNSYFELDLDEQANVICSDNCRNWLRVYSGVFNKKNGKQLFQLICDTSSLSPGTMVVGNIDIINSSFKKTFWVIARVIEVFTSVQENSCGYLAQENGHKYYFENGFVIGNKQVPGCSEEKQAILLRENGGGWAIFSPWVTQSFVYVNDFPVSFGQRIPIDDGDKVSTDTVKLTFRKTSKTGGFYANQTLVDFGILGASSAQHQIQIISSRYGKAKLVATVPWIEVSPFQIDCQPGYSNQVDISIRLHEMLFDAGKYRERGAILVQDADETLSLDVCFEITSSLCVPKVSGPINFGVVSKNWNAATASTNVQNDGTKTWTVDVNVDQSWLKVIDTKFDVLPGQVFPLILSLDERVSELSRPGNYTATVILRGADASLTIPASIRLCDWNTPLDLDRDIIDFGEINSWDALPASTLYVTNTDDFATEIKVVSNLPWLEIEPRQINCQAFQTTPFTVKFNGAEIFKAFRIKKYHIIDAICFYARGVEFKAGITADVKVLPMGQAKNVTVKLPLEIGISLSTIDFGNVENWNAPLPKKEIVLKHNQPDTLAFQLETTVPWLEISPQSVLCSPAGCIISVSMRGKDYSYGLRAKRYEIEDAIIVKGGGLIKKMTVKVNILQVA